MKKSKFITILLITVSTMSLIGCGSSNKSQAPAPQKQETTTKSENKDKETNSENKDTETNSENKDTATKTSSETDKVKIPTTTVSDPDVKLITQEQAVDILKQGYLDNGVDLTYQRIDNIDNHLLLKFYTMHSDENNSTVIDNVLYVDGQTRKVYHHNGSGVLVETIKK